MWETWVRSLGQEDPLEKETATHSSILAWRIPWKEELGGLQSTGRRVRHDWATSLSLNMVKRLLLKELVFSFVKFFSLFFWFRCFCRDLERKFSANKWKQPLLPRYSKGLHSFLRRWPHVDYKACKKNESWLQHIPPLCPASSENDNFILSLCLH